MHGWWPLPCAPGTLPSTASTPGAAVTWVPAKGLVEVNGLRAKARDGVAIEQEDVLQVTAIEDSEIVLVDVA